VTSTLVQGSAATKRLKNTGVHDIQFDSADGDTYKKYLVKKQSILVDISIQHLCLALLIYDSYFIRLINAVII